ncbi:MAG: GntR family transcriptional regulator [Microcystaceae cyanobacterium]
MSFSSHAVKRNKSLKEQVYEALHRAILSGEFTPGMRLIETQLSQKLQVSRTPIREALQQLQQENLVVSGENNVLQVVQFSIKDAGQLYDCRAALEKLAVAEACKTISPEKLDNLGKMLEQSQQLSQDISLSQFNQVEMLDLDYCFHRLIAESSGNLWLCSFLDNLFNKMKVIRTHTLSTNPLVLNIYSEHEPIYQAIVHKDSEKAVEMMNNHLMTAKERVISEMEKRPEFYSNSETQSQ